MMHPRVKKRQALWGFLTGAAQVANEKNLSAFVLQRDTKVVEVAGKFNYYANDFIVQLATWQSFQQCISAKYTWYAGRCSGGLDGNLRHAIACINGWQRKLKLNLIAWFE